MFVTIDRFFFLRNGKIEKKCEKNFLFFLTHVVKKNYAQELLTGY